jgi:gluconolactonase
MRIRGLICIAVGLMLTAAAARGEEVTIVSGVLGPEGPLFVDGNLYFVGWTSGTLSKWDGKDTTVLNSQPGCSHNGLALTKQKIFLLACTDEHGAMLELDIKGKQLRRSDADDKGSKFDGGINDIVVTEAKESSLPSRGWNLRGRSARSCKAWRISRKPA